ncbi:MAG: hypothetical protein LBQ54_16315 [Planctomycetaceae bacterium]|jgi:hypothetical protein|nr:hypothetical protein [Planctomycetaceae bacterium]
MFSLLPPPEKHSNPSPRSGRGKHRLLRLEELEQRELLSATQDNPIPPLPYDLAETFRRSNDPAAEHTIYLDFTGYLTQNTAWNTDYGPSLATPAFSLDGDDAHFSDAELMAIQYIWECVAEDFSPFHVNVTTAVPSAEDLMKTDAADSRWGIRVVIGGSGDWFGEPAGGVAYDHSFPWSSDTPCFVFSENLLGFVSLQSLRNIAEAVTHEVGHTLGLSHDGLASPAQEYYTGHDILPSEAALTWAPIMGTGYNRNLVQWSRGEYNGAGNGQDDLFIITHQNGFGYRTDDYGNDMLTASVLAAAEGVFAVNGIVETNTDRDYFLFQTAGGLADFYAAPSLRGGNLDVQLELFDGGGTLLATSNTAEDNFFAAEISIWLEEGVYYLCVTGCGKGNPADGGYSDYGSLGQYTLTASGLDSGDSPSAEYVTLTMPDGSGPQHWTVRQSGESLLVTDENGVRIFEKPLTEIVRLEIRTPQNSPARLTLDGSTGTPYLAEGLFFTGTSSLPNVLEILGTETDDTFRMEPSGGHFNGLRIRWENVRAVQLDGLSGNDQLEFRETRDGTSLVFQDSVLRDASGTFAMTVSRIANLQFYAAGRNNQIHLFDSPESDTFTLHADTVSMQGNHVLLNVGGFQHVETVARSGNDTAYLYGEKDTLLVLNEGSAEYYTGTHFYRVWNVHRVIAVNEENSGAVLLHTGSNGTDYYTVSETAMTASNSAGTYYHEVTGFSPVFPRQVRDSLFQDAESPAVSRSELPETVLQLLTEEQLRSRQSKGYRANAEKEIPNLLEEFEELARLELLYG